MNRNIRNHRNIRHNRRNRNSNFRNSVVLVNKICKGDKEYKKQVALKFSSVLNEAVLFEIINVENEVDYLEFDENLTEIEDNGGVDKDISEYSAIKDSTEDDTLYQMQITDCNYSYDSNFKGIKVSELLDCSTKILHTNFQIEKTKIRNILFLGSVVFNLRNYLEQEDSALAAKLINCHEKSWIKRVRFLLTSHFSTLHIPDKEVWKISYLKQAYSLYELYFDYDLLDFLMYLVTLAGCLLTLESSEIFLSMKQLMN
jgi:hypothetical protein